jgi:hypothetical protein
MFSSILAFKSLRRATAVQWSRCLVAVFGLTMALLARAAPVARSSDDSGRVPQSAASPAETKDSDWLTKEEEDLIDHRIIADTEKSAPRQFIGLETVLKFDLDDLESQPEDRRPFLRYLTLANLYNIRATDGPIESDASMEMYRAAVTKLVNCLSTSPRITIPTAIDPARTLFRLDLRDYEMTPQTWEGIVNCYPNGIVGASLRLENRIQAITHSRLACLRADWFVFATSQPPLYDDILHLPATELELERKLGVNTLADLRAFRAIRAAIFTSDVSFSNRLIERHEIGTYSGAYWKSYDFKRDHSGERQNHLSFAPLGPIEAGLTQDPKHAFEHDSSEIMFQLPNGLIRGYLSKDKPGDSKERAAIERLYPDPSILQATIKADADCFQKALHETTPGYTGEEPVHVLYQRFLADLVAEEFSTEFWKNEENMADAFDKETDPTLQVLASKMKAGFHWRATLSRGPLQMRFGHLDFSYSHPSRLPTRSLQISKRWSERTRRR